MILTEKSLSHRWEPRQEATGHEGKTKSLGPAQRPWGRDLPGEAAIPMPFPGRVGLGS